MSNLTSIERARLEKLFQMEGGSVLDFSHSTLENFIAECVEIDFEDEKYEAKGTSKAKKLRYFWKIENNQTVSNVLKCLLEYYGFKYGSYGEEELFNECKKIAFELETRGNNLQDLKIEKTDDEQLNEIIKHIDLAIKSGSFLGSLDRFHTFMTIYFRNLCKKHDIEYSEKEPINSVFGKYRKNLEKQGYIENDMCITILKQSVSLFEKFNNVRNNNSLAHPNSFLDNNDSILIYRNIKNIKEYIDKIEKIIDMENLS